MRNTTIITLSLDITRHYLMTSFLQRKVTLLFLIVTCIFSNRLSAQNAVSAGEFIVEPPTLTNLGFQWHIKGDDNRNATVAVAYREVGMQEWKEALPLHRMGDERVIRETEYLDYQIPHLFAG